MPNGLTVTEVLDFHNDTSYTEQIKKLQREVSEAFGIPAEMLQEKPPEVPALVKLIRIPKKKRGEFRLIAVPNKNLKYSLRNVLNNQINKKVDKYCDPMIVTGCRQGYNPVVNASFHIGYRFSFSMDLKDFFDTVTPIHVGDYLNENQISKVFIDGHIYQGLPTSAAVANLAAAKMDKEIKDLLGQYKNDIVFTRYCDDMAFSFNFHWDYEFLKANIPPIIAKHKFQLNERKSRLQDSLYGNRSITGVHVNYHKIVVSRALKRRLRAVKFQNLTPLHEGLSRWAEMKLALPPAHKQLDNLIKTAQYLRQRAKFQSNSGNFQKSEFTISKYNAYLDRLNLILAKDGMCKSEIRQFIKDAIINNNIPKDTLIQVSKLNTPLVIKYITPRQQYLDSLQNLTK